MGRKIISITIGFALAAGLWTGMEKYPLLPNRPKPFVGEVCFWASLPGEIVFLLTSSGNHGVGLGITDNKVGLLSVGMGTNAILYAFFIWLLLRRVQTHTRFTTKTAR